MKIRKEKSRIICDEKRSKYNHVTCQKISSWRKQSHFGHISEEQAGTNLFTESH
jgi:hypothetical protein